MKIPKGYRRLKPGEILQQGDKYTFLWPGTGEWINTIREGNSVKNEFYIRKIETRKLKGKKL